MYWSGRDGTVVKRRARARLRPSRTRSMRPRSMSRDDQHKVRGSIGSPPGLGSPGGSPSQTHRGAAREGKGGKGDRFIFALHPLLGIPGPRLATARENKSVPFSLSPILKHLHTLGEVRPQPFPRSFDYREIGADTHARRPRSRDRRRIPGSRSKLAEEPAFVNRRPTSPARRSAP